MKKKMGQRKNGVKNYQRISLTRNVNSRFFHRIEISEMFRLSLEEQKPMPEWI